MGKQERLADKVTSNIMKYTKSAHAYGNIGSEAYRLAQIDNERRRAREIDRALTAARLLELLSVSSSQMPLDEDIEKKAKRAIRALRGPGL